MRTKQLYFATKARTHDSARTHKTPSLHAVRTHTRKPVSLRHRPAKNAHRVDVALAVCFIVSPNIVYNKDWLHIRLPKCSKGTFSLRRQPARDAVTASATRIDKMQQERVAAGC